MGRKPAGNRATPAETPQTYTLVAKDPEDRKGRLKSVGGSQSDRWNNLLVDQVANALWLKDSNHEQRERQLNAAVAAMVGIAPNDELEGMMAAQLIAAHAAVMDCHRRVMTIENYEARNKYLGTAAKLSRSYAMLLEALNRHRGKGQQHVTVEHVHVHQGGQAVVGVVEAPGGREKLEDQGRAHQIAHAPEPAMWGQDAARELVPVAGDGERSLSHARRSVAGRAEGQ